MNKAIQYAVLSTAMMGDRQPYRQEKRIKRQAKKIKQCLRSGCNQQHTHNNSFCSVECCKAWKAERNG